MQDTNTIMKAGDIGPICFLTKNTEQIVITIRPSSLIKNANLRKDKISQVSIFGTNALKTSFPKDKGWVNAEKDSLDLKFK
jgi:hypothetical protein